MLSVQLLSLDLGNVSGEVNSKTQPPQDEHGNDPAAPPWGRIFAGVRMRCGGSGILYVSRGVGDIGHDRRYVIGGIYQPPIKELAPTGIKRGLSPQEKHAIAPSLLLFLDHREGRAGWQSLS
jgi:hypothetical protein